MNYASCYQSRFHPISQLKKQVSTSICDSIVVFKIVNPQNYLILYALIVLKNVQTLHIFYYFFWFIFQNIKEITVAKMRYNYAHSC